MDLKFTNDIVIENGDLQVVTGPTEIAQGIRDRLMTFKSEWFLDLSYGPDYRADILVKNPSINVVNAVLKKEILKSADGQFTRFDAEFVNRKLTISYDLQTSSGEITEELTL